MELETTVVERVIHLALFVAAGIAAGVVGLAFVERLVAPDRRSIRAVHLTAASAATLLVFGLERLYHAL